MPSNTLFTPYEYSFPTNFTSSDYSDKLKKSLTSLKSQNGSDQDSSEPKESILMRANRQVRRLVNRKRTVFFTVVLITGVTIIFLVPKGLKKISFKHFFKSIQDKPEVVEVKEQLAETMQKSSFWSKLDRTKTLMVGLTAASLAAWVYCHRSGNSDDLEFERPSFKFRNKKQEIAALGAEALVDEVDKKLDSTLRIWHYVVNSMSVDKAVTSLYYTCAAISSWVAGVSYDMVRCFYKTDDPESLSFFGFKYLLTEKPFLRILAGLKFLFPLLGFGPFSLARFFLYHPYFKIFPFDTLSGIWSFASDSIFSKILELGHFIGLRGEDTELAIRFNKKARQIYKALNTLVLDLIVLDSDGTIPGGNRSLVELLTVLTSFETQGVMKRLGPPQPWDPVRDGAIGDW